MNYFVYGYTNARCSEGHTPLYAGTSRGDARAALEELAPGLQAAQLFVHPVAAATKRRAAAESPSAPAEVGAPEPDESAPADEAPEAESPQEPEPLPPAEEPTAEREPLPLPLKRGR